VTALPTLRWVLLDEDTDETVTLTINPNTMDAFPTERQLTNAFPSRNNQERQRTFQLPNVPGAFSWGGAIRTEAQFTTLRTWVRRSGIILVTDHMGRSFRVVMRSFKPDRKPRRPGNYRMKYTINTQWIERVS